MKIQFLLIVISLTFGLVSAQDSIKLESEFAFELKGQHILSALHENRIECFNCLADRVRDNPFHHFAIYSGVNYKGTLNEKYTIETGLYLEERSFSGGNNTLNNLVVFPKIRMSSNNSFQLAGRTINLQAAAGDFWDESFNDLIRFYNIDFHGLKTILDIGDLSFGFYVIGDLSKNIGFDLHELYKFSIQYQKPKLINDISWSINKLHDEPRGNHPTSIDFNVANYFKYTFSDKYAIAAQLDVRLNKQMNPSMAIATKLEYKNEELSITTALRYYQSRFNRAYANRVPRYRLGNSYIGRQLYPLKNYYRPLNQWALITQYQNEDVLNWELVLNWEKQIYKGLGVMTDIDVNILYKTITGGFDFYPLYNLGVQIKFLKNFDFTATITNKHMTLDRYFQTADASKLPFLSYGVKLLLTKIPLKTIYIR